MRQNDKQPSSSQHLKPEWTTLSHAQLEAVCGGITALDDWEAPVSLAPDKREANAETIKR